MSAHPLSAAVGKVRDALTPPTDGQLVARFVRTRDGAAFAALVDRHGPTVFGVLRAGVGDHHLAEDAFQAVFLVLARRAAVIDPPDAVGGWLFGVAHRTALEARTLARRRAARERVAAELPEAAVSDPDPAADLRAMIDAELAALPPKYRDVLVACDLDGRPRVEVAAAFGLAAGTLSSRLAEARKRLADRLRRRGVTAAGGLAAAVTVPPEAVAAAQLVATQPGAVPASVAALASRVTRAMSPIKLKLVSTILLTAAVVAGTGVVGRHLLRADDPPPPKAVAKPAVKPRPAGPALYYPTTVGAKWTYQYPTADITDTVTKVEDRGKKIVSVGQVMSDGTIKRDKIVEVSPQGVFLLASRVFRIEFLYGGETAPLEDGWEERSPSVCLLKLPAKPGGSWTDPSGATCTTFAAEKVKVPAGEFTAIPVESARTINGRPFNFRCWYAPGVGAVKWVAASGEVIVLKAFSRGKD